MSAAVVAGVVLVAIVAGVCLGLLLLAALTVWEELS